MTGGRNGVEASFFEKKWTAAIRAGRQPQTTGRATARSAPCALIGFSASITIATIMSDTHSGGIDVASDNGVIGVPVTPVSRVAVAGRITRANRPERSHSRSHNQSYRPERSHSRSHNHNRKLGSRSRSHEWLLANNSRETLFRLLRGPCVSRHSGPCSVAPARQRRKIKQRSGFAFGRGKPVVQFLFCLGLSTLNPIEKFSRSVASPVRKLIAQHDVTAARDFDCAAPFEVAQNARDCLNSQAK